MRTDRRTLTASLGLGTIAALAMLVAASTLSKKAKPFACTATAGR